MPGVQDIKAGRAYVEMGLQDDGLKRETEASERHVRLKLASLASGFKRLGLAISAAGTAITGFFASTLRTVAGASKLQDALGLIGESIPAAQYADALRFAAALKAVGLQAKLTAFQIGSALVGPLTELAVEARHWIKLAGDWASRNGQLIRTVAKLGVGLTVIGSAIYAIGALFSSLAAVGASLTVIFTGLAGAVSLLLTPLGLLTVGFGALGVAAVRNSGVISQAIAALGQSFRGLLARSRETFAGIAAAMRAGELPLAAKILWLSLRIEFDAGLTALKTAWSECAVFFELTWVNASANILSVWLEATDSIRDAFDLVAADLAKSLTYIGGAIQALKVIFTTLPWNWKQGLAPLNRDKDLAFAGIDAWRDERILDRQQKRQPKLADIEAERKKREEEILGASGANQERLRREIDALERERANLIREAFRRAFQAAFGGRQSNVPGNVLLNDLLTKSASRGTFSAAEAQLFGSGDDIQSRILHFNEVQARLLGDVADNTKRAAKRGRPPLVPG